MDNRIVRFRHSVLSRRALLIGSLGMAVAGITIADLQTPATVTAQLPPTASGTATAKVATVAPGIYPPPAPPSGYLPPAPPPITPPPTIARPTLPPPIIVPPVGAGSPAAGVVNATAQPTATTAAPAAVFVQPIPTGPTGLPQAPYTPRRLGNG